MDIETFRSYCLEKPGVEESFPFGEQTLVFKVLGKMFALTGLDEAEFRVNLKCDPERAVLLREAHPDWIRPGWHMNKKHWNTVIFESELSNTILSELIDHSYDLVVGSLPKKYQQALKELDT